MYSTSIFKFAVLALATAAAAVPTSPLNARDNCGVWYDNYLGPGSGGDILGNRQCQQTKKAGEDPNDESKYTFNIKGACIHCDFYTDENCGAPFAGVGHSDGSDWNQEYSRAMAKSFRC